MRFLYQRLRQHVTAQYLMRACVHGRARACVIIIILLLLTFFVRLRQQALPYMALIETLFKVRCFPSLYTVSEIGLRYIHLLILLIRMLPVNFFLMEDHVLLFLSSSIFPISVEEYNIYFHQNVFFIYIYIN